jgi:hypothetical protein
MFDLREARPAISYILTLKEGMSHLCQFLDANLDRTRLRPAEWLIVDHGCEIPLGRWAKARWPEAMEGKRLRVEYDHAKASRPLSARMESAMMMARGDVLVPLLPCEQITAPYTDFIYSTEHPLVWAPGSAWGDPRLAIRRHVFYSFGHIPDCEEHVPILQWMVDRAAEGGLGVEMVPPWMLVPRGDDNVMGGAIILDHEEEP